MSIGEGQLSFKKKQREGYRLNARKELERAQGLLAADDMAASLVELKVSKDKLIYYRDKLQYLCDEIAPCLDDTAQSVDIAAFASLFEQLLDTVTTLEVSVAELDTSSVASVQRFQASQLDARVRLPKLEIDSFDGDPLRWQEFWDSFETTIHAHPKLSNQEKFKYLRRYLKGEALNVTQGYRLTSANYESVVGLLNERFGNTELAVFSHLDAMLAIPVASTQVTSLQHIFDECEMHIRSLVALGLPEDTFGRVFTPIMLSKLPHPVRVELHRRKGSQPWTLSDLRNLLREEIYARMMGNKSFDGQHAKPNSADVRRQSQSGFTASRLEKPSGKFKFTSTASALITPAKQRNSNFTPTCFFCQRSHYSSQCRKVSKLQDRHAVIGNRCFLCLKEGHSRNKCTSNNRCYYCKQTGRHHSCLCPTLFEKSRDASLTASASTVVTAQTKNSDTGQPAASATNLLSAGEKTLMQTAFVTVNGQNGSQKARLLLDIGASRSFCKTSVCQTIDAKFLGNETVSIGNFEVTKRKNLTYPTFELELISASGEPLRITVNGTSNISCPIQRQSLDPTKFPLLKLLPLADNLNEASEMSDIDILIGSDYYYDIVGSEQIRCSGGLVLLGSMFGYIVAGRLHNECPDVDGLNSVMFINAPNCLSTANYDIERFWRLEEIGIKEKTEDSADTTALRYFNKTVMFDDHEQRYQIRWPWKVEDPDLPDNYRRCVQRLKSIVSKTAPGVLSQYHTIISDQLAAGIIEESPAVPDGSVLHYLPHHAVIKPDKETTKLRIVYYASSKASRSLLSLNDCLNRGPVFLSDLCGLLMRFRLHKVAAVSDIEKAFLQISLYPADRDVTRFLWLRDMSKPPVRDNIACYRFQRVPFGVISSPFLLAAVIRHHLQRQPNCLSSTILRNLYADNVVFGASDPAAASEYYQEAKSLFSSAHMNLRQWYSNDEDFVRTLPTEDAGRSSSTKVLGLDWELQSDTLACASLPNQNCATTKRSVLQDIARIYDPLGFLSPATIQGRCLMQKLWEEKLGWDDPIPKDLQTLWNQHAVNLKTIRDVRVQRCVALPAPMDECTFELHAFCDASKTAYGAAVYLLSRSTSKTNCQLVFAKGRVAPLKKRSIPQLELIAATMATRLAKFVRDELDIHIKRSFVWCDSQCVLYWIMGREVLTPFVRNRVAEIKTSQSTTFVYVPTTDNPADLITRGITIQGLISDRTWWQGPSWLAEKEEYWPEQKDFAVGASLVTTIAPTDDVSARCESEGELIDYTRFSRWSRAIRVVAWIYRYRFNSNSKNRRGGPLSAAECSHAETVIIHNVQSSRFASLFTDKSYTTVVHRLGLHLATDNLIRCAGRLDNSDQSYEERHPILLPKTHHVTKLLIEDIHAKLSHAGVQHVLCELRRRYWVVQARSQIKSILRLCQWCQKIRGGPYRTPEPPPFPDFRAKRSTSFSHTGLDYLGPLYARGNPRQKVWICVFTCCSTRAVHLELVADLTVSEFLLGLRRFMSLYGQPDLIVCDNASQFRCAEKALTKTFMDVMVDEETANFAAVRGIAWKFTVEMAPWMGGFYEKMVGLVKRTLKAVLGRKLLSMVHLQTVVYEAAAVLNRRPLTYLEDEVTSKVITPNDLITHNTTCFPAVEHADDEYVERTTAVTDVVRLWKHIEAAVDHFWSRWRTDYLNTVRLHLWRPKNRNTTLRRPQVEDVVIIKDALPRNQWRLGRVAALNYSHDGLCRSAKVRLPNGRYLNRPIRLLFPLETTQVAREKTSVGTVGQGPLESGKAAEKSPGNC